MPTTIAQFGLGPIGIETLRLLAHKPWARIVGGIDIDPAKIGHSLAELTGLDRLKDAKVYDSYDELRKDHKVDVVLHTAGSKAAEALAQMEPMVRDGVSVASTCEELLFPALRAPAEAKRMDELCRQSGARIVGTGVNPGFVMDVMPVCITGVSRSVKSIRANRVVNASTRRMPLQRKIGSGMDPQMFRDLYAAGKAGHAGFNESAALIAHCMGWPTDDLAETCEPVVADQPIRTEYFSVEPGQTRGLDQQVVVRVKGEAVVTLTLRMALDEPDPHDRIVIEGDPALDVTFNGGVAGDHATVAALVNVVPRLLAAPAGVRLMTELSVPSIAS